VKWIASLGLEHLIDQLRGQLKKVRGREAFPVRRDHLGTVLLQPTNKIQLRYRHKVFPDNKKKKIKTNLTVELVY
jgi:hypothetical protein